MDASHVIQHLTDSLADCAATLRELAYENPKFQKLVDQKLWFAREALSEARQFEREEASH